MGSWWDFEFYFLLRFVSTRNTASENSGTCTNSQFEMRRSKCSELQNIHITPASFFFHSISVCISIRLLSSDFSYFFVLIFQSSIEVLLVKCLFCDHHQLRQVPAERERERERKRERERERERFWGGKKGVHWE